MKYSIMTLGLLLALCLTLSACSHRARPVEAADSTAEGLRTESDTPRFLRIADESPETVDPQRAGGDDNVALNVFDRLVEVQVDANGVSAIAPSLAEAWQVSDDGLTYTFTLRQGVHFSNGSALTSSDVGYTLRRLLTQPDSRNVDIVSLILGAEALRSGEADTLAGFRVLSDTEFSVTLSQPYAAFLACLSTPGFSILDAETTEAAGEGFGLEVDATVGTGPFVLHEWRRGERMLLAANGDCWQGAPRCPGIEILYVGDVETCRLMFEEGDLDLLDLDSLGDDAEYFIHGDIYQPLLRQGPRTDITYVALNAAIEPLDDVRVRRAMQLALDRDSIMRITCSGRGTVENGIIPRGLIGHNPDLAAIPFDLKEAERLLDEAGYPEGFELPMVMPDTSPQSMRDLMNLLIFMWRRVGIYARVAYVSEEQFIEQRMAGEIACHAATWSAEFDDPDNFMEPFFSSPANARRHSLCYGNEAVMTRVAEARSIVDEEKRLREYRALEERLIQQDAAWIPLYSTQHYFAVSQRVNGFRVAWNGGYDNRYSDVALLDGE